MRPILLKMKAFLSYKDEITIDFSTLNEGLYLISGPTGSGKTSIFDAIVFALYGEASGNRNKLSLRSDFADDKDETYVELTFEVSKCIYTLKRTPSYKREGYKTLKQPTALLTYNDEIIEGNKEVNQKIIDILGINLNQFKQIVMISQGEFTKLIYANSEEREKVLRRIFDTYYLMDLETELKEKVREYKEDYLKSLNILTTLLKTISFLDNDEFHPVLLDTIHEHIQEDKINNKQLYIDYKNKDKQYNEVFNEYQIKQLQNQKIKQYHSLNQEYQELIKQEDNMKELNNEIMKLDNISMHSHMISSYHLIKKQYSTHQNEYLKVLNNKDKIEKEYSESLKQYNQLNKMKQDKDELLIKVNESYQKKEKKKLYEEKIKNYKLKQKELLNHNNLYSDLMKTRDKLTQRIERDEISISKLPELTVDLKDMDSKMKDSNDRRIQLHELSELFDELENQQEKHFSLSNQYNKASQDYNKAYENYRYEDEKYKRQQAGILALELEDNKPCPVCGSLHHPHIATLSENVLSAHQLEQLNKKLQNLLKNKEEIYNKVVLQNEEKTKYNTRIKVLKEQLGIEEELSKKVFIEQLSEVTKLLKERKHSYLKMYEQVEYLKKLSKSVEVSKGDKAEIDEKIEMIEVKINKKKEEISRYEGQLKEYENIDFTTIDKEYETYQNQYQKLDKIISKIEKNYLAIQKQKIELDKELQHYHQLIDNDKIEKDKQEKLYYQYIKDYFKDENEFLRYYNSLKDKEKKEKIYSSYILNKERIRSNMDLLKKDIGEGKLIDISELKKRVNDIKIEKEQLLNLYQQHKIKIENDIKIYQNLLKEYDKNKMILSSYQHYLHLSDMTSGKNPMRLSFERYVLSFYFENILEYANIEFSLMSQGRYQFIRKTEVKGNSKQGLELSVMDYETGIEREVQSLSGGESFKAALSLALGLSSMIQSYAGGIELNTLFIDEGFGTLDDESLNQAISVLMGLEVHHKTIGIISHVNELKEKIDNQIIINKGNRGSHLTVNFHK